MVVSSTSIESPESHLRVKISKEYRVFQDVFSKQCATKLPLQRLWDCTIELLPAAPPKGRIYPLSIPEQRAIEENIEEALTQGFIRPSTSPAAFSFFFVAKKDVSCIDYRALSSQTVKYRYPLPLVPSALEQLRGSRFFTKLDLHSAYNLIQIRRGGEWKTAFITPAGHYEYRVMPYGLANSPSVFLGFMNEVFWEFLHHFVIVYIDDVLIYSQTLGDHPHQGGLSAFAGPVQHLFLKLEKCEFRKTTIAFLGYIISAQGIEMDQ